MVISARVVINNTAYNFKQMSVDAIRHRVFLWILTKKISRPVGLAINRQISEIVDFMN
jgi:hypothetical protein